MRESDYDVLLADLYAGVTEPERLRQFMQRLGDATGSHATALIRQDFGEPVRSSMDAVGVDPQLLARYRTDFPDPDDNIWFARTMQIMRTGAVLNGDDWVSKRELVRTRYYADFLHEMDTAHSVGMCAVLTPAHAAFLTPCRSARRGAYDSDSLRLFGQLGPHWVNAYALLTQFEHLRAQVAQADRRQRAMFLFDRAMRWIGGNEAAERMVAAGWWRGRRGGLLESGSTVTRAAWHAAQRRLTNGVGLQPTAIPVYDALASLVAFARLQPYGAVVATEDMPHYVLFVRPLQSADDDDLATQLRGVFDLTAGEAGFAVALRRQGDLAQAAAAVGITEGSARTRLQSVFEKTETHRQVDLLRMLDALADTLA